MSEFENTPPKTNTLTKVRAKTQRPRMHKVILLNDDYTPR